MTAQGHPRALRELGPLMRLRRVQGCDPTCLRLTSVRTRSSNCRWLQAITKLPTLVLLEGRALYKAMTSPSGWTNPVKVRCGQCSATLYINQTDARRAGGWECPHCGKRH